MLSNQHLKIYRSPQAILAVILGNQLCDGFVQKTMLPCRLNSSNCLLPKKALTVTCSCTTPLTVYH